jgi:hypothetical protein
VSELPSDVKFQSVMFGERSLEVSYIEGRDRSPSGMLVKTAVINNTAVQDELAEVESDLLDLLDHWLTLMRNPPEEIRGRGRD